MTNNRVAGNRAATAREADHHAFGRINRDRCIATGARFDIAIGFQLYNKELSICFRVLFFNSFVF